MVKIGSKKLGVSLFSASEIFLCSKDKTGFKNLQFDARMLRVPGICTNGETPRKIDVISSQERSETVYELTPAE